MPVKIRREIRIGIAREHVLVLARQTEARHIGAFGHVRLHVEHRMLGRGQGVERLHHGGVRAIGHGGGSREQIARGFAARLVKRRIACHPGHVPHGAESRIERTHGILIAACFIE